MDERKHILVVDDEENIRLVLSKKLAKLGIEYQVELAQSGEDALRKVSAQIFDLVISDLRMPGVDGLELMRRIRAISPRTRLILITSFGTEQVEEQAHRLGVYQYITKPFVLEELVLAARQATQRAPLRDSQTITINDEFDIVAARLRVRKLAVMKGFDIIDQARISLATSSVTQILELGENTPGQITIDCLSEGLRTALRVVCIKVAGTTSELPLGAFEDMRKMVDDLIVKKLPSNDLQVTLVKWNQASSSN